MQEMRQHQSRGARSDDSDLRAHVLSRSAALEPHNGRGKRDQCRNR